MPRSIGNAAPYTSLHHQYIGFDTWCSKPYTSKLVRVTTFTGDTYASRWHQVRVTLIAMFAQPWHKRDAKIFLSGTSSSRHACVTWLECDASVTWGLTTSILQSRHARVTQIILTSRTRHWFIWKILWSVRDANVTRKCHQWTWWRAANLPVILHHHDERINQI